MYIFIDTTVPYEFKKKEDCFHHITLRCHGIKKSVTFGEKDKEHLCVRCPLSGDYLEIFGKSAEIEWLDVMLKKYNWYRPYSLKPV